MKDKSPIIRAHGIFAVVKYRVPYVFFVLSMALILLPFPAQGEDLTGKEVVDTALCSVPCNGSERCAEDW